MQSAEADSETLGEKIGMTKKELATRADELQRQQQAASARIAAQAAAREERRERGCRRSRHRENRRRRRQDRRRRHQGLARSDHRETAEHHRRSRPQSGLIANTRADLEALKHKGDRQYYEFTLLKGAKPQAFSTVALQLKKTDPKHGKYSLNVTADDKTIEKKDKNQNEPVQFYTGRDHMLYELVVWTVDKNKITGYLSTPKNAPVPITATPQ